LEQIRNIADLEIDTSKFNVHELRTHLVELFKTGGDKRQPLLVSALSFGFKNGVPESADLVFDVRFLPNPHFIAEFRPFTGKHPQVAKYIRSFPQTQEFIAKVMDLLLFLLPFYVAEGKSYLTVAFGCTSIATARDREWRLGSAVELRLDDKTSKPDRTRFNE
jgi:UPF0042 nucleotide-binding protein